MIHTKTDIKFHSDLILEAPHYFTVINRRDEHLAHFKRKHTWGLNAREIDIFGHCWSLAWFDFANAEVSVKRKGQLIPLEGPRAIFIPPFTIIDWQLKGGSMYYEALLCNYELPNDLPKTPVLLSRNKDALLPSSFAEIIQFVRQASPLSCLAKEENPTAVAVKAKNYIDSNFEKEFTIADMAAELRYSHAVMDRAFKNNYELSPLEYRNRLRVLDSAHQLILEPKSVSQVSGEVGFSGTDNYNKQFKKIMKVPPSKYAQLRPSFLHNKKSFNF